MKLVQILIFKLLELLRIVVHFKNRKIRRYTIKIA